MSEENLQEPLTHRDLVAKVADASRVSVSTVYRALKPEGRVRDDTRQRIMRCFRELGGQVPRTDIDLGLVGIIMDLVPDWKGIYGRRIHAAVAHTLWKAGMRSVLIHPRDLGSERFDRRTDDLLHQVDGLIWSHAPRGPAFHRVYEEYGIPSVILLQDFPEQAGDPHAYVGYDNRSAGKTATEHPGTHGSGSWSHSALREATSSDSRATGRGWRSTA
jgi:DNA-binding LacI/PurR family transcriptional regulator